MDLEKGDLSLETTVSQRTAPVRLYGHGCARVVAACFAILFLCKMMTTNVRRLSPTALTMFGGNASSAYPRFCLDSCVRHCRPARQKRAPRLSQGGWKRGLCQDDAAVESTELHTCSVSNGEPNPTYLCMYRLIPSSDLHIDPSRTASWIRHNKPCEMDARD